MNEIDNVNLLEGEYELMAIESIEVAENEDELFDIEVADDHTFTISAENIISHNCNSLVKGCTIPALKTNCSIIFLNHIYDGPEMYPSKIKNQSGGHGLQYMATMSIQCAKKLEKPEDSKEEEFYAGSHLKFFTIKNRLARPFIESTLYIDFKRGFTNQYEGLVEACLNYGFLIQQGAYYTVPSFDDKKRYLKEILKRDDIWDTFLEDFNVKSIEDLQYSKKELIEEEKKESEIELEIEK